MPDKQEQLMQQVADSMAPDTSPSDIPQPGVPAMEVIELPSDQDNRVVLSDDEITAILDNRIVESQQWVGSEIALQQAKALEYYLGEASGDLAPPEVDDRSAVVDTVVSDQIEWLMPSVMEIMYASGSPVRFTPRKPGDEEGAEQMTHLVNHIINDQNCGFQVIADWAKTAFLSKVGVVKVWVEEEATRTQEKYRNLTDGQLAIISDDAEVTITALQSFTDPNAERAALQQFQQAQAQFPQMQAQYAQAMQQRAMQPQQAMPGQPPQGMPPPPQPPQAPDMSQLPMLHNVTVTRSKKEKRYKVECLNPEEFIISPNSRRIGDGFCAHMISSTVSDLIAKYGKKIEGQKTEELSSDSNATQIENSELYLARHSLEDVFSPEETDDGNGDPSQRRVKLFECYLPIDCDGDGIAEWRKITKAGNIILDNEVCDGPPFASFCPIPIPGLFYGRGIADLAMPIQRIKTGVLRAMQDNMNLQINGRTWAVAKNVNMDDLLTNRPGGIVRVNSPNDVGPIQQGMADMTGAMNFLQYVDTMSQERTGITKYSQGLDADTLNHTATGIENITQRADLRVKMIVRTFAETGMKDLFRLIQKMLMNYQDQNMVFQLDGSWVDVDPRVWRNQYSMTVTVGTGTGDMTRRTNQIMQVMAVQQQGLQVGIATPEQIFHSASELVKTLQLGEPSQFFVDPAKQPPKPPQPPIELQVAQIQQQTDMQKAQMDQQTSAAKAKQDYELSMAQIQAKAASDQHAAELKAQLELQHQSLIDKRERDAKLQSAQLDWQKFVIGEETKRINAAVAAKATSEQESALDESVGRDLQS
jgi:hypothetical protein